MKHYGDITKIKGVDVPPVNVVIGGSPCQDLSVAGKRAGLAGERSGLFMEQLRIVKEMRYADEFIRGREGNNIRPRFMVWENVPGAFSSNKGEDFGAVLQETVRIVYKEAPPIPIPKNGWPNAGCLQLSNVGGQCSVAWRVLDAQFWGVPQRRRRIALVADFGGMCAGEILFERKGMSGYSSKSRSAWKTTPAYAETSPLRDDYILGAKGSGNPISLKDDQPIAYSFDSMASNSMKSNNPKSGCREVDRSKTLDTSIPDPSKNQGGIAIVEAVNAKRIVCMATQQGGAEVCEDDKAPKITAADGMSGNNQPVICIQGNCIDRADTAGCNGKGWTEGVSYTLNTIDRPAVAVVAEMGGGRQAIAVENYPNDSRVKLSENGTVQTLSGRMGTGGGNTPMVLEFYSQDSYDAYVKS